MFDTNKMCKAPLIFPTSKWKCNDLLIGWKSVFSLINTEDFLLMSVQLFCCRENKQTESFTLCIKIESSTHQVMNFPRLNRRGLLPGYHLLNHFLHPESFRVQANLLTCLFQRGTENPKPYTLMDVFLM